MYELRDVGRTYRTGGGEVRAVEDVDLDIAPGELIAIEGPSGSGKSTLLQLLGALDTPSAGTIAFDGRELNALGDADRTKLRRVDFGFVFQHFNLIPTLTAAENVEAALVGTCARAERRTRALELLEQVGLAHRTDHLPSRLSGGEQQRVAIARALANRPRVLLADEPTGNLDSATAEEIMNLLAALAREHDVTVIVVTHAEDVARRADRRIRLRDGRIAGDERVMRAAAVNNGHPRRAGRCADCGSDDLDPREECACAGCGRRFVRKASGRAWKPCPACGGHRRTVARLSVCGACGARGRREIAKR